MVPERTGGLQLNEDVLPPCTDTLVPLESAVKIAAASVLRTVVVCKTTCLNKEGREQNEGNCRDIGVMKRLGIPSGRRGEDPGKPF